MSHISLVQMTRIHQALADPLRVLIIYLLLERELQVGEMVVVLKEPQHKVSRNLAILKQAGLLRGRRQGTRVHYEISPALGGEWKQALESLRLCWDKSPEVKAVLWRMHQILRRTPQVEPKKIFP